MLMQFGENLRSFIRVLYVISKDQWFTESETQGPQILLIHITRAGTMIPVSPEVVEGAVDLSPAQPSRPKGLGGILPKPNSRMG